MSTYADKYEVKNANRIAGRDNGSLKERREARDRRRQLDGKFGWLKKQDYNDLLPGTTGTPR